MCNLFQFYIMGRVGRVAKNILRLRELVTTNDVKTRALLSSEGFMQPAQAMTYENKFWIKLKLAFPWL